MIKTLIGLFFYTQANIFSAAVAETSCAVCVETKHSKNAQWRLFSRAAFDVFAILKFQRFPFGMKNDICLLADLQKPVA